MFQCAVGKGQVFSVNFVLSSLSSGIRRCVMLPPQVSLVLQSEVTHPGTCPEVRCPIRERPAAGGVGSLGSHGLPWFEFVGDTIFGRFFFFLNLALITSLTGHSASLNGLDRLTSIYGTAANFSKGTQSKKHIILAPRCGWCWGFKCHASIILAGLDQGEDGTRVECVSFRCTGRHRFAVKPQHREHRSGLQVGFYELQLRSFKGIHYCQLQGNRAACSI